MATGSQSMRGGRGSGGGFPLQIKVSLMDNEVVQAGLHYYAELLAMTPQESDNFKKRYFDLHNLENNVLVEATLQTSWTEIVLNLKRYTIFIEDDAGNQYEPVKITEQQITSPQFTSPVYNNSPFPFQMHRKQVLLYFPGQDIYGKPLIHQGLKFLKIAFIQDEGGPARAEGIWTFNWQDD